MSNVHDIGYSAQNISMGDEWAPITKIIVETDDSSFSSGNDSGRALTVKLPWGTQALADKLVVDFARTHYTPFTADGAMLDPSAELGDDLSVGSVTSRIFSRKLNFNSLMSTTVGAPGEDELDHEYPYQDRVERDTQRQFGAVGRSISGLGSGLNQLREGLRQAEVDLTADIGDVRAGLYAIASADDIEGWKAARTTLFATISDDISEVDSRLDLEVQRTGDLETASASLTTRVGNAESSISAVSSRTSTLEQASANLTTRVGNAESGLDLLASKSIRDGLASAKTSLYAKIMNANGTGFSTAMLNLSVVSSDGHTKTLAALCADVVELHGNVYVEGGNLRVGKSILSNYGITGASVYANGTGTQGIVSGRRVSCTEFAINGQDYTPQSITSTSGGITVLAQK